MSDDLSIEHQLLRDGTLFEQIDVLDKKIEPTVGDDDWHLRLTFRVEEDLVATCALGLIFVHDGRPRGVSGEWFEDDDQLTVADMLRHLTFEPGGLHLYLDYLRGRCLKTTIDVSSDGKVVLDTVNRGQAATRWVDRLKGKKPLQAVASS
jgi:hypothetical protein